MVTMPHPETLIREKRARLSSMRFPSLDVMIQYGIYTVKELTRFAEGRVAKKKNIVCLNECARCQFVYEGSLCLNCQL